MTIPDAETGERLAIGGNEGQINTEATTAAVVPVEDVITRVGQVALPTTVPDPGDPDRYVSYSHPTDVTRKLLDTQTREVIVQSDIAFTDRVRFAEEIGPWAVRDLERVAAEAEQSRGLVVGNVNPTANGGGVQYWLMNRVPLSRDFGIDERWPLMPESDAAFRVTKDWHNNSQGVAVPEMTVAEFQDGLTVYEAWIRDEVEPALRNSLAQVDLAYLHDPQPHGLYDFLPPGLPTIWQSHIENRRELIADPNTIQHQIWKYLWEGKAERAQVHLFHPVDSFVPGSVPESSLGFAPAPFEAGDDLNRRVTEQERVAKRKFWDEQLRTSDQRKPERRPDVLPTTVDWDREDWTQTEMDWDRPFMAVVARFDAAKNLVDIDGNPSILEHYAHYREMMVAQGARNQIRPLVIAGNGSIDDPDGDDMLALVMHARADKYQAFKDDIKVVRVPHDDLAINVLMTEAEFGLQPSRREGFENRVSEWIWHNKAVVVAARGGMPLQVLPGRTGFVEDAHNSEAWAVRMTQLSIDYRLKADMARQIDLLRFTHNYREFSTLYAGFRTYMHYNRAMKGMYRGDHRWRTADTMGPIAA